MFYDFHFGVLSLGVLRCDRVLVFQCFGVYVFRVSAFWGIAFLRFVRFGAFCVVLRFMFWRSRLLFIICVLEKLRFAFR